MSGDPYSPTESAKMAHQLSNTQFAFNIDYAVAVVKAPAALFVLGFLSLIILNGVLLCRCFECCFCLKCVPTNNDIDTDEERIQKIKSWHFVFVLCLFLFLVAALSADNISFYGNESITAGAKNFQSALNEIQNIFDQLKFNGATLTDAGNALNTHLTQALSSCAPLGTTSASNDVSTYDLNSNSFFTSSNPVTDQFKTIKDYVELYAIYYKNIAFYTIWALAMMIIILMTIFQYLNRRGWMKFSIGLAMFVFFIEIILCVPLMILASVFGDICYPNPTANVLNFIGNGQAKDILTFYTACTGTNIIQDYVTVAKSAISSLQTVLSTPPISLLCSSNADIALMQGDLTLILATFTNVDYWISCSPVQSAWFRIFNTAVCGDMVKGFYVLWITQLITSFSIFMMIIFASISYEYYDLSQMHIFSTSKKNEVEMNEPY